MVVYLYDNQTGKLIKSYRSGREGEQELNICRGTVSDAIKYRNGKYKNLQFSYEKYDIHPLYKNDETILQLQGPVHVDTNGNDYPVPVLLTEDELKLKHDMFYIMLQYLKKIPEGKFIEETSMLRQLGFLGKPRYRDAISRPEIKEYKGRVDGVTYYGSPVSVKKLKSEGILL